MRIFISLFTCDEAGGIHMVQQQQLCCLDIIQQMESLNVVCLCPHVGQVSLQALP